MSAPVVSGATGAERSVEVLASSAGHLQVKGALTFATARKARQQGLRLIDASSAGQIEIDCGGVTASDSAGLTVLLDWLTAAKNANRSLRLLNLPAPIRAVAQISDVADILEAGAQA